MEDSCIYISDDEEVADVSVQILAEVKPSLIDLTEANKSISQKESRLKEDKIQRKLEREQLKQQRQREKDLERVQKEVNRANTASKAYQNCTAVIDKEILSLIEDHDEANFRTLFEESSMNYKLTAFSKYDHCVTWEFKRAELEDGSYVQRISNTDLIMRVMDGSEYVRRICLFRDKSDDPESLNNLIGELRRKSQARIVILVYKLGDYMRKEKQKEARKFRSKFTDIFESGSGEACNSTLSNSESTTETDLDELRLMLHIDIEHNNPDWKVHIEFREKTVDVVSAIVRYTRSTAGHEIKKKEKAITSLDWAINMDKDKAIDPTRGSGELTRLWIAQLQQFSSVTLPIAKTIAAEYPSPSALLDQYSTLTQAEAQDLLASLHVQRNLRRQIGQNISRRIYRFMTSTEPDVHIGYD